jgi:hypothetical protein
MTGFSGISSSELLTAFIWYLKDSRTLLMAVCTGLCFQS